MSQADELVHLRDSLSVVKQDLEEAQVLLRGAKYRAEVLAEYFLERSQQLRFLRAELTALAEHADEQSKADRLDRGERVHSEYRDKIKELLNI